MTITFSDREAAVLVAALNLYQRAYRGPLLPCTAAVLLERLARQPDPLAAEKAAGFVSKGNPA